jgi:hypothetical protein
LGKIWAIHHGGLHTRGFEQRSDIELLQVAFILLCIAQIIHFSHHLAIIGKDSFAHRSDKKLKSHLKWNNDTARRAGSA